MYSIILCGGSGTRLWPLSRKNFPKQFLKLYSGNSLLQETFLRMKEVVPQENIYFVTNEENYFNVLNQVKEIYSGFSPNQVLKEPASLNTMPAIALAAKYLVGEVKIDKEAPIIMVPSDHYIGAKEKYVELAKKALSGIGSNIGTIGIIPTTAHTGLGYIKKGEKGSDYHKVLEFKEKPDKKTAEEFFRSGEYLWNAGMYLFNVKTLSEELERHAPEFYSLFEKDFSDFLKNFKSLPAISIDYAISEKSDRIVTYEGDFDWSDIGSFDALAEILKSKKDANPKHVSMNCENVFVHSANDGLIVTSGLKDVIVIENNDSILVQKMGESDSGVKKVVEYLKEKNYPQLSDDIVVYRPWGKYEVLVEGENHKVKKFTVYSGESLSLQMHKKRAEHWVVVKGTADIVNGEKRLTLHESESTFIPLGTKHKITNPGKTNLEIIEVQTGEYLEEDDIIRFEDIYGRK